MPPDVHRPDRLLRSLQRHNAQHNNGDSCRQVWPSQALAVCFPRMRHALCKPYNTQTGSSEKHLQVIASDSRENNQHSFFSRGIPDALILPHPPGRLILRIRWISRTPNLCRRRECGGTKRMILLPVTDLAAEQPLPKSRSRIHAIETKERQQEECSGRQVCSAPAMNFVSGTLACSLKR